jgi:hypothetical protein
MEFIYTIARHDIRGGTALPLTWPCSDGRNEVNTPS